MFRSTIFYLLTCAAVFGALDFTSKENAVSVKGTSKTAEWICSFTNTGKNRITITSIKTDCGCTSAVPSTQSIGRGESGILTIKLNIASTTPPFVEHVISVFTDDKKENILKFSVSVVRAVAVTPKMLLWSNGDTTAKKLFVRIDRDVTDASLVRFDVDSKDTFAITWESGERPGEYIATVIPKAKDHLRATIVPVLDKTIDNSSIDQMAAMAIVR